MRYGTKRSSRHGSKRLSLALLVFAATFAVGAFGAVPAGAQTVHLFKETFGSASQPPLVSAEAVSVDQSTGDVLVIDTGNGGNTQPGSIRRFKANGEPDPFSALGTNVIDGTKGPGNKSCALEPASCDLTPENGFTGSFNTLGGAGELQVAIDESGGVTDGNIYLTQHGARVVTIFAADGHYLGQLSKAGSKGFGEPASVVVDPSGTVYIGSSSKEEIFKCIPSANPPLNADCVTLTTSATFPRPSSLALGSGPTAGSLFVSRRPGFGAPFFGGLYKLKLSNGEFQYAIEDEILESSLYISIDPGSGRPFEVRDDSLKEWDAAGASSATLVSTTNLLTPQGGNTVGIAIAGASGDIYATQRSRINVYGGPLVTLPDVTTEAATGVTPSKATLQGSVNPDGVAVTECFFEYGATTAYGSTVPCEGAIPTDSSDHAVHAALTGLPPNGGQIHFRLVAKNANGSSNAVGAFGGADRGVSTTHSAVTEPATAVSGSTATLHGTVNPDGGAVTECFFEYGITTAYGSTAPCEGAIGTGESPVPIEAQLAGLVTGGSYHFRLVATNSSGADHGSDLSFSTQQTVETKAATELGGGGATLNGTVNPTSLAVGECLFEYVEADQYDPLAADPYAAGDSQPCAESEAEIGTGSGPVPVHAKVAGLKSRTKYHFRLVAGPANAGAAGNDVTLVTLGPLVSAEWAVSVARTEALLRAQINPEGSSTTYHLEYGKTGAPYEHSTPESTSLGSDNSDHTVSLTLSGLEPGATFHYRFVATSSCNPAEAAEVCTFEAPDLTFTTLAPTLEPKTNCPNQAFRTGASASLSDCRAFEMVSPVDKQGSDIEVLTCVCASRRASLDQAASSGERLAYSAYRAFADPKSAIRNSEYMAVRHAGAGWGTENLSPPKQSIDRQELAGFLPPYRAFSEDLCTGWVVAGYEPLLAPGAIPGWPNLYSHDNCGPAGYEALSLSTFTPEPTGLQLNKYGEQVRSDFIPAIEGFSADGSQSFFSAQGRLTADASSAGQLYGSSGGAVRLVCYLPGGAPLPGKCAAGSGLNEPYYFDSNIYRAVASDASRVYWNTRKPGVNAGRLYLREHPFQPQSTLTQGAATGSGELSAGSQEVTGVSTSTGAFAVGQTIDGEGIPGGTTVTEIIGATLKLSAAATQTRTATALEAFGKCAEADMACTLPVSNGPAVFAVASPDGSKALYTEGDQIGSDQLLRYDRQGEASSLIAGGVPQAPLGASEDTSRVYFVSTEALGTALSPQGKSPKPNQPNLYLFDSNRGAGERYAFLGTLSAADVDPLVRNPVSSSPYYRTARVSPDGLHVAFTSSASLTGYDNTDQKSGKADGEVFIYSAAASGGGGRLSCVSCDPTGARPLGRDTAPKIAAGGLSAREWFAAEVPGWGNQLHPSAALAADGERLFFNSYGPLVPRDTNGAADVYEWEPGASQAQCEEAGAELHLQREGGCLSLVSSGESPFDSSFVDASADGRDVFFKTSSSLLPQDPGLLDIYDAREGGGFPAPPGLPAACEGEACQGPLAPPDDPTPGSASFAGAGNVREKAAKKKSKKKHHKKAHKKHSKRSHRRANDNRRAAR